MMSAAHGQNILIAGGGGLAAAVADAGLLDQMYIGVVPVLLGAGKPVFTSRLVSAQLKLSKVEQMGQLAYLTCQVLDAD